MKGACVLWAGLLALGLAGPANAQSPITWQGSITIYDSSAACRTFTTDASRRVYDGNSFRSVFRPANVNNITTNGPHTDISFITQRSARSYRLLNGVLPSGTYEMRGVQGFGRWTGNTSSYDSFVVTSSPTIETQFIRLQGWIHDFSNVPGCSVFIRATYTR